MRTKSNLFTEAPSTPGIGETSMKRKGGAGKSAAAMGSIMAHDEGPSPRLAWPS